MRQSLRRAPAWALLSLAMNGLLFIAVLVLMRPEGTPRSQIAQANAFASEQVDSKRELQLGERHRLDYQQWVGLLEREAAVIAATNPPHQTVLLGDSISLWFPNRLLPGRRTWINQAISGENSGGLLRRLPLLDATNPETIFLMVGINDLIWGKSDAEFLRNAEAIAAYLRNAHPDAQLVVQSILPHGGEAATWEGRDRLQAIPPDLIRTVNSQLKAVAIETGVEFLDLYPLFVNGDGYLRADLTSDGLHLNQDGYMVWRTALALLNETEFQP
ncbi:lysophospholipase [filamentous cyanobacterium CCP5]|nr:lysophospholipase [filamentous cyanobacterium CCP5]